MVALGCECQSLDIAAAQPDETLISVELQIDLIAGKTMQAKYLILSVRQAPQPHVPCISHPGRAKGKDQRADPWPSCAHYCLTCWTEAGGASNSAMRSSTLKPMGFQRRTLGSEGGAPKLY